MSVKRVLAVVAVATVLHTGVVPTRPARADTATNIAIGVVGFLGYVGLMVIGTMLWNRSKEPETTSNWAAIDPATLDRQGRPDGVRGPFACKPDAAGLTLLCW